MYHNNLSTNANRPKKWIYKLFFPELFSCFLVFGGMDEKPLARVHHTHHQYMPRKLDTYRGNVLRKVSLGMDRARIILSIGQSTLNQEKNATHTDSTDTHKRAGTGIFKCTRDTDDYPHQFHHQYADDLFAAPTTTNYHDLYAVPHAIDQGAHGHGSCPSDGETCGTYHA